MIATLTTVHIIQGSNADFGQIRLTNSYRSEVYASLAAQLFLKNYAEFFRITIANKVTSYCNDKYCFDRLSRHIAESYLRKNF